MVDRSGQIAEELREALEVGGIERRGAWRAEFAWGVFEAFRLARRENQLGSLSALTPGRFESDAGAGPRSRR